MVGFALSLFLHAKAHGRHVIEYQLVDGKYSELDASISQCFVRQCPTADEEHYAFSASAHTSLSQRDALHPVLTRHELWAKCLGERLHSEFVGFQMFRF